MNAQDAVKLYTLPRIASRILDRATEDCERWVPGASKVFLSDVCASGVCTLLNVDATTLKELAFMCHQAGLLVLSRADMVEIMDPAKVAASSFRYLGSEFHFIEVPPATVYEGL